MPAQCYRRIFILYLISCIFDVIVYKYNRRWTLCRVDLMLISFFNVSDPNWIKRKVTSNRKPIQNIIRKVGAVFSRRSRIDRFDCVLKRLRHLIWTQNETVEVKEEQRQLCARKINKYIKKRCEIGFVNHIVHHNFRLVLMHFYILINANWNDWQI